LLRTILTFLIIAIGITALVGILTATDSIESSINENFTSMGANTYMIRNRGSNIRVGKKGKRSKRHERISYREAKGFKDRFTFPATVSLSARTSFSATVKHESDKTNPNVQVLGVDENYTSLSGYKFMRGRNFSEQELISGRDAIILGYDVAAKLFADKKKIINEKVSLGSHKYNVIGVLESKGTSLMSTDNLILLPLNNARNKYTTDNTSFVISVAVSHPTQLDPAISESTGLFRSVRKVTLNEENNFEITRSDNLATMLLDLIEYATAAAAIIGFITLFGAAIGLMNIMLVSVTERTREIGISKSIGATSNQIMVQFLTEAVVICQIGGLLGIILGIFTGNIVSMMLEVSFIIPWTWIISGIIFCFAVGMLSGIYPAIKASRLDPIEALRSE